MLIKKLSLLSSSDKPGTPSITSSASTVYQDQPFTLTCTSSSSATLSHYSWHLDGGAAITNAVSSDLTFTAIRSSDSGSYTCKSYIGTVESDSSPGFSVVVLGEHTVASTFLTFSQERQNIHLPSNLRDNAKNG